jgi:hypothetical protein
MDPVLGVVLLDGASGIRDPTSLGPNLDLAHGFRFMKLVK